MPRLTTIELVLANHNGSDSPYEWSSYLPDSLEDIDIDPDTYSRTIHTFNAAYNVPAMRRSYRLLAFFGSILLVFGQILTATTTDKPPALVVFGLFSSAIGAVLFVVCCIYKCTIQKKMRILLIKAIQQENDYYRELYNQRASPLTIVWSLSSRTVIAYDGECTRTEEEPMIVCEVTEQSEMISATEIEIAGETSAIIPDSIEATSVEQAEGIRPEGAAPDVTIAVDEEYAVSVPPASSAPHDQYVRQLQIMNGEREELLL